MYEIVPRFFFVCNYLYASESNENILFYHYLSFSFCVREEESATHTCTEGVVKIMAH